MKLIERMDTQNKQLLLRRGGRGQIERVCTSDCVYIFHTVGGSDERVLAAARAEMPRAADPMGNSPMAARIQCHSISK